ncbi:MAG: hypothetical protein KBS64_00060 [Treponema sp.]|nr:hypothetical protein [Candidatus Treponema equi]
MEESKKTQQKKKPLALRIIKAILFPVLLIILAATAWTAYSIFDRASTLSFIPKGYNIIIHTDSAYDALEPLVSLNAAETILAEPTLAEARDPYMKAREFVNSATPLLKKLLNRRIDAAIYTEPAPGFIATVDLGWMSAATRLSSLCAGFLHVKNLSYGSGFFEYKTENSVIYMKPFKNLVVITASKELFENSTERYRTREISKAEHDNIEKGKTRNLKIMAPSTKLAKMEFMAPYFSEESVRILGEETLSSISFSITNDNIELNLSVPVNKAECNSPSASLLLEESTIPKITHLLSGETQYYTLINLCPLEKIRSSLLPVIQKSKDIESSWKKADNLCKTIFSLGIEDILFSWSGREAIAFGLEGSSDPVFALQIKDEKKRKEIFNKIDSSFLVNTNTSLIVNGMRLPCLELPGIISGLLSAFGVTLPRPFYLVHNGYIYFSMSPQNLSAVYNHTKKNHLISKNINWKNVSGDPNQKTSVELYYNLKRSLPFFLDNSSITAKILKLYGIGRFDIFFNDDSVEAHVFATSVIKNESGQNAGFPKATGKISDFNLVADSSESPEFVYWIEDGTKIKCLDLSSLSETTLDLEEQCNIVSAERKAGKENRIWASTDSGKIYLLNKKLQCAEGFPIDTGNSFTAPGAAIDDSYAVPANGGILIIADKKARCEEIFINEDANFRSAPAVLGNTIAIYSKGFEGEIYLVRNSTCINIDSPMIVDGIGFGSPSMGIINNKLYTAFITQSGTFHLFEDGIPVAGIPLEINNVFSSNVVFSNNMFYALSENAQLYRISPLNGTFESIKLPDIDSAKEGIICTAKYNGTSGIFASGDSNILYGFTPELELLMSFPLAGRGTPVFADVNKDKKTNCMVLSISREINSWRLQ